ncbi:MAG: dihydroorotase, partial [Chitinophagales bacterium]
AGFSKLCLMPNTFPPMDNSTQLAFAQQAGKQSMVDVLSLGAISQGLKGKDIAEIYDMYQHGAIAFTDGSHAILDAGLMERALWYVKKFDGLVMSNPDNEDISLKGQMNEGVNSTLLGLEGVPKLAEELMVSRDLYLLEHTNSRLHFTNISTKKSVDLIRKAKKKGLHVSASVNVANLMFDDSEVLSYDTNFKVKPHLREQEDVQALLKGLADNTIDLIASGHTPLHIDEKKVEFENAEFGMSTIDCTFQASRTVTCEILDEEQLIDKFLKGYELLNQNRPSLAVGEKADYTVFQMDGTSKFQVTDIHSKGKNNPFVGKELMGAVIGVIKGNKTNIS